MSKRNRYLISLACLLLILSGLLAACGPTGTSTLRSDGDVTSSSETETEPAEETESAETGLEWPALEMGDLTAPDARITAVTRDTDSKSCTVLLSDMNQEQAELYIEYIEQAGFNFIEMHSDGEGFIYNAGNELAQIDFMYYAESDEGILVYSILTQESSTEEDPDPSQPVLLWPGSEWPELPVFDNDIEDIIVYDEWDVVVFFSQVSRISAEAYIEELRPLFAIDAVEQQGDGAIFYLASNEAGDYLEFYWADDLTASIELIRWSLEMTEEE